jgi:hypothetical protein
MLSGYLMTSQEFQELQRLHEKNGEPGTWGDYDIDAPQQEDWPFLSLKPIVSEPETSSDPRRQDLAKQLEASAQRFFKVWRLYPALRWLSITALGVSVVLAMYLAWMYWDVSLITVGGLILMLLLAIIIHFIPEVQWLSPERTGRSVLRRISLALFGYLATQVHLRVFDPLFLKRGSLERLLKLAPKQP